MPEGDTIATYVLRLRPLLVEETIRAAESRWPDLVRGLPGVKVTGVRALGKNLLIDLSDRSLLRVHLGMHGTWHRYAPGEKWLRSRSSLAIALETDEHVLVCFSAPTVQRIDARGEALHPTLAALGPELMDAEVDLDLVVARAIARGGPLGEVLLDQDVATGIGNVFKCELAFVFRLDPFADIGPIGPEQLRQIFAQASVWLRANVGRWRNTTGFGPGRPPLWVYGRGGKPCLRCGTRIDRRTTGQDLPRITYWCPRCQTT